MGQSQTSHSVPAGPQGCDTSGDGATLGLAETEGEASPGDSAQELRELRGHGALGKSKWDSTLTAHSKGKPKIKSAFI